MTQWNGAEIVSSDSSDDEITIGWSFCYEYLSKTMGFDVRNFPELLTHNKELVVRSFNNGEKSDSYLKLDLIIEWPE